MSLRPLDTHVHGVPCVNVSQLPDVMFKVNIYFNN